MWEKIKNAFAVIGAVLTVAFCTFVLVFLRRRDSDRRGSNGVDERDSAIKDGIADSQGRIENVEGRIETVEESVGRCEEHLHRAEAILRNAIRRSREDKRNAEDVADNNSHI